MKTPYLLKTKILVLFLLLCSPLMAQKSGQSMHMQYGIVVASKYVQERSNAGRGALIGGAIGLYAGKGKSTSKKIARTAGGAAIGAGTSAAIQGNRDAREYQVQTAGGVTVIISDQTEIDVDDCVVIETPSKGNSNIRRVSPTYCQPESSGVVAELQDEMLEEAEECVAAKRELAAAGTDEAVDRALRKISILCDM